MKLATNQKQPHSKGQIPLKQKAHLNRERKRIADDLHDEIGPMLAALKLRMHMIKGLEKPDEIFRALDKITSDLDFLILDVRKIIRNITPDRIERDGLIKSIEEYRKLVQTKKIHFDFRFDVSENHIKEEARLSIYRIIIELINNSIKHSQCKIIKLFLISYPDKTIIIYTDDGCQITATEKMQIGMGLKSIRTRVNALRGKMFFDKYFQNGAFYQILFDNKNLLKR